MVAKRFPCYNERPRLLFADCLNYLRTSIIYIFNFLVCANSRTDRFSFGKVPAQETLKQMTFKVKFYTHLKRLPLRLICFDRKQKIFSNLQDYF